MNVVIVGCGALGSMSATLIARSNLAHQITLIDDDRVEAKNLYRQIMFDTTDVHAKRYKVEALAERLQRSSDTPISTRALRVTEENADDLLAEAGLVIDGTDNFEARRVINRTCVRANIPWIYGGVNGSFGSIMALVPPETPCFDCFNAPGPEPKMEPVESPIVAITGAFQANEAMRILQGQRPNSDLRIIALNGVFTCVQVQRNPACSICGVGSEPWQTWTLTGKASKASRVG